MSDKPLPNEVLNNPSHPARNAHHTASHLQPEEYTLEPGDIDQYGNRYHRYEEYEKAQKEQ